MGKYSMATGRYAQKSMVPESGNETLDFDPPEALDKDLEGDSGEAQCSWERRPDGKVCITAVNGVAIGKYAKEGKPEMDDEENEDGGESQMESEGGGQSNVGDEEEA